MNNPAPGASRRAVGTAPLHNDFSPPDPYSVRIELNVEGRLFVVVAAAPDVVDVELDAIERVD
jgi:hypothetical protein